jgi:hypothetical protein
MIYFLILLGVAVLVFLLWTVDKYETACTGECEQGRRCNCLIGKNDE